MNHYRTWNKLFQLAVTLIILPFFLSRGPAFGQQKDASKSGPVTSKAAYNLAVAAAAKWQSDARLFDFSNLTTAPVDVEGRSAEWTLKFFSKNAGKVYVVALSAATRGVP